MIMLVVDSKTYAHVKLIHVVYRAYLMANLACAHDQV